MHVMKIAVAEKFEEKLTNEKSLKSWWQMVKDNESDVCVVNGLMYKSIAYSTKSFIKS